MSKYIDLADRIKNELIVPKADILFGIEYALRFLDDNPDQVPGRTITESELGAISDRTNVSPWAVRAVTTALGHEIVPEPEPTNAEKWTKFLSAEMDIDIDPWQAAVFDQFGVKAPGGDDE